MRCKKNETFVNFEQILRYFSEQTLRHRNSLGCAKIV